jgi:hypothetical protein
MIDLPTTSTGEVRSVGNSPHNKHLHHTRLGGVGVWCEGSEVENTVGKNRSADGLKQTGYRGAHA